MKLQIFSFFAYKRNILEANRFSKFRYENFSAYKELVVMEK